MCDEARSTSLLGHRTQWRDGHGFPAPQQHGFALKAQTWAMVLNIIKTHSTKYKHRKHQVTLRHARTRSKQTEAVPTTSKKQSEALNHYHKSMGAVHDLWDVEPEAMEPPLLRCRPMCNTSLTENIWIWDTTLAMPTPDRVWLSVAQFSLYGPTPQIIFMVPLRSRKSKAIVDMHKTHSFLDYNLADFCPVLNLSLRLCVSVLVPLYFCDIPPQMSMTLKI